MPRCRAFAWGAALFVALAGALGPPSRARADTPELAPPWLEGKPRLHDEEIAKKNERGYFTGIPLLDADPDTGYGGGGRGYYYWNGTRKNDPFFDYTAYRQRVYLQAFLSNKGFQDHQLDFEWLYVGDSPLRLRATLLFAANAAANYFGIGNDSMSDLTSPATGERFARYDAYNSALRQVDASGHTYAAYNQYGYYNPAARVKVERDLFGALMRVQGGLEVGYVAIRDRTGDTVSADAPDGSSTSGTSNPTKLHVDCAAGRLVGCGGGWNNTIKLGVALDTRDFEPDPNAGAFIDLTTEISSRAIGSSFDYLRLTFSPRVYFSPAPKWADVVIAGRVVLSEQTAGTPFFSMDTLASTGEDTHGLGGSRTIRGYRLDRFVGPALALANVEVRWTMFEVSALAQRFSFALVPFLDVGRVFDSFERFTFNGWRRGQGAGLRVAWNQATVGAFDLGFSSEDTLFYTEFNHPF